ncbi:hypothetical protein HZH66_007424 [Vespula vulgaris]|uniref:Uncharacterized protein n=1 Tax=Vespula vulgaris TaxID=7454 RepID=A0A834JY43_VESVU|nr:hypothetical protein HZH66_007424 [Vespula vulgaris]
MQRVNGYLYIGLGYWIGHSQDIVCTTVTLAVRRKLIFHGFRESRYIARYPTITTTITGTIIIDIGNNDDDDDDDDDGSDDDDDNDDDIEP